MLPIPDAFEYEYRGGDIMYGRGEISRLQEKLDAIERRRALVVTGSNVAANPKAMDPVSDGLGDRLVGVFDGTTPAKSMTSVFEGIDAMRRHDANVLVGLGGGSSLDIARQMSVFASDGRSLSAIRDEARSGAVDAPDPDADLSPVVVVPTTFTGADLSNGGTIEILPREESPTDNPIRTKGSHMPTAFVHDPDLFESTPIGPLSRSAMNGFNKGIETPYSKASTPLSDATAIQGLRLLRRSFPRLHDERHAMERAVVGIILVQFERQGSIVHSFGKGIAQRYDIQQGVAHAILVPHVLRYLFDRVDAKRAVLAEGLGVDTDSMDAAAVADAVIAEVAAVRDGLELPTRLRELGSVREEDLSAIAAFIREDAGMANVPAGLDPTANDLEAVLRAAW